LSTTSSRAMTDKKRIRVEKEALLRQLAISFAFDEDRALNVVSDIDQELLGQVRKRGCPSAWVAKCWTAHRDRIMQEDIPAVEWPSFYDEGKRCWCCGRSDRKLQRCHIVPRSTGGSDEWSNIVPMCSICHDRAPDVDDPSYFFEWIKSQANPLTGLGMGHMWHQGLCLLDELKTKQIPKGKENYYRNLYLEEAWSLFTEKASSHASQSNAGPVVKPSTWEWIVRQACKVLPEKPRHPSPFL